MSQPPAPPLNPESLGAESPGTDLISSEPTAETLDHPSVRVESFFPGFDGLRAIAALMVLVTHVWLMSSYRNPRLSPFLTQLDIGVPVFFVISGFLLYRPFVVARFDEREPSTMGAFWKRRVLRIFPAYWVCLVIVSLFMYHGPLPIDSVKSFFTHFFLLQIYSTDRVIGGPVQQSWTLAVEVAFYAFLPFYAWGIRRVRSTRFSAFAIELSGVAGLYLLSVAYRVALLSGDLSASQFGRYRLWLPGFLDQLALGMGLAVISAWFVREGRHAVTNRWFPAACWAAAAFGFWIVAIPLGLPESPTGPRTAEQFLLEQFVRGLFALLLVLPVVLAPTGRSRVSRFLTARTMVFLGLVSYGIYLWHEAWIDTYLAWRDLGFFQASMVRLGAFTLLATIPTAAVSYYLIERPALRLKDRRIWPPNRTRRDGPGPFRSFFGRWGRFEWTLAAIVVGGLALRLAYIWFERRPHWAEFGVVGDANFYHRGGQLLAEGKGFINTFNYDLRGIMQQDGHPPLYITWLAIPSFFGFDGTTAHMLWTVIIGAATIAVVGYTGREIVGPRVGLIAAFLAAIYPNVWSHDGFLTSETMAIFTTTLVVWLGYRYWRSPSMRRAIGLGLAVGVGILGRSEMVVLIVILVIPLILATRNTESRERWRRLVAAGIAVLVLVGPWMIYNLTRFEKPVPLSSGYGVTLLASNCDLTYYGRDIGYWNILCALPTERKIKAWTLDQSVAEAEYRSIAFDYIKNHKKRLAYVTLVRWARFTGLWDLTHNFDQVQRDQNPEGREAWVAWSSAMMWFVLAPLAVGGAFVLRRRKIPVYIVAAPILVTFITITITFHQNRYRASAETAICLLAAVAIDALVRRPWKRRPPPPTPEVARELVNA